MSDLIDRQAAIDVIDEWIKAFRENGHRESAADARFIQDGIIQLPSVQPVEDIHREKEQAYYCGYEDGAKVTRSELPPVQERKGRLVELYDSNYKCSECGAWWTSDEMDINEEFRFCPSCGAHMEGVEDAGRDE